jgi:hypothetical protein
MATWSIKLMRWTAVRSATSKRRLNLATVLPRKSATTAVTLE